MFQSRVVLCLPFFLTVLGACTQDPVKPEPLDFDSDLRILRGTWVGEEINGNALPLLLYLKASAPTQDSYQITGFFQEDVLPVKNVAGTVTVPLTQGKASIAAQQSSTCSSAVFAQSQNLAQDSYELCGEVPTGSPPRFDLTLTYRNDRGYSETYTYSMTRQPSELADPDLLVRGKLVYAQGEPLTHPEPFEFTEDSHAIVQFWWWTGPTVADVEPELVTSTTLENISSFPIEYRLEGDAEEIFARRGEYYLNVGVFSGSGGASGEEFTVGDLTNEVYTLVPNPGADVEVKMTSLESCDSPAAGGRCL